MLTPITKMKLFRSPCDANVNNDIHNEDEDDGGDILLCLLVYSAHRHCLLISTENWATEGTHAAI